MLKQINIFVVKIYKTVKLLYMKNIHKLIIIFLFILLYAESHSQDSVYIKECNSYLTLYESIKIGIAASIEKTAWMMKFSLVEESLITVYPLSPPDAGYKVVMRITNLEKGKKQKTYEDNSILGYLLEGCDKIYDKYSQLINTSCYFYTDTPEEARDAAEYGITEYTDENYLIAGELIKVYMSICKDENPVKPQPVKKPAIYLYPENTLNVKVNVTVNGTLTSSEPLYSNGWDVTATPEGIIDGKYDYLFYEADLYTMELPDEGWIVEYSELEKWFDDYLPKLGLNGKETEQFKEYWLKDLKEANYYDIRLLGNNFLEDNMKLTIIPEPQTIIRVNFYFKPLDEKIVIKEPVITEKERKGFTVVEWGGINGGEINLVNN